MGVSPTLCYLVREKKSPCCLQISKVTSDLTQSHVSDPLPQPCDHCPFLHARDYNWTQNAVILAADYASNGIYNFVVPLRAHFHNPHTLRPIVLLLERRPAPAFIDAISWFPLIYWMQGSIDN